LRDLLGPVEEYRMEVYGINPTVIEGIKKFSGYLSSQLNTDGCLTIDFQKDDADEYLTQLIKVIIENNGKIRSISCDPISLKTIFDYLTQKRSDEKSAVASALLPCLHDKIELGNPPEEEPANKKNLPTISADRLSLGAWLQSKARIAGALIKRDMLSETSYRFSFFMQIVEIFLTIIALYFLSQMLGQETVDKHLKPYGGDYFSFALIGVAFYSYFNIGFSSFAKKLQEAQSAGTLEAMLSTPADLSTIVLGSSLWQFIMTTIRVLVFLISGAVMFGLGVSTGNMPLAVLILMLTIVSASSFGIMSANFIIVVKRGDPISWLFKSASWILGGVVFPVTLLPLWMQKLSLLLPTVHALKAIRLVLLQGATFKDVLPQIAALCIFCFLLLPVSLRTLKYAVRRAKREGSLTHY
jgi:ABC-2 type transport system permease protein